MRVKDKRLLFGGIFKFLDDKFPLKNKFPSTSEILHDLSLEVLENIRAGAYEEFKQEFNYLIDAYVTLIKESKVDKNRDDNLALLSRNTFWGGFERYRDWYEPYRQIVDESVKRIDIDDRFFQTCCRQLGYALYAKVVDQSPQKVTASIINWAGFVFYSLSLEIQKRGIMTMSQEIGEGDIVLLPVYLKNLYDPELKYFISGWETLEQEIVRHMYLRKSQKLDKDRLRDLYVHLHESALLICRAVSMGDLKGTEWLIDTYLRWNDNMMALSSTYNHVGREFDNALSVYTSLMEAIDAIEASPDDRKRLETNLIFSTYQNLWFDKSIMLVGVLLDYHTKTHSDLPMQAAVQVYSQKKIDDPHIMVHLENQMDRGSSILASFVRFVTDGQYSATVSERLGRGFDSPMDGGKVLGRVYSGTGGNYIYETFVMLFLISMENSNKNKWLISLYNQRLLEYILNDGQRYVDVELSFHSLRNALNSIDWDTFSEFYELVSKRPLEITIPNLKEKFEKFLKLYQRKIKQGYNSYLANLEISDLSKEQLQTEFSINIFTNIEQTYPLKLFSSVNFQQNLVGNNRIREFIKFPKDIFFADNKRIRDGIERDKEHYLQHLTRHVAYSALDVALGQLPTKRIIPSDKSSFWKAITNTIDEIRKSGKTPLILSDHAWPEWFSAWQYDGYDTSNSPPPENYSYSSEGKYNTEYAGNYFGHIYKTPVLTGFAGHPFVILAQEELGKVTYKVDQYGNKLQLTSAPNPTDRKAVKLQSAWELTVSLILNETAEGIPTLLGVTEIIPP